MKPQRVPMKTLPFTMAGGVTTSSAPPRRVSRRLRDQITRPLLASTHCVVSPIELYSRPLLTKGFDPWYDQTPCTLACPRLARAGAIEADPLLAMPPKPTA